MKKEEIFTIMKYLQFEKSFNCLGISDYGRLLKLVNDNLKIVKEIPKDLENNYFVFLQESLKTIINKYDNNISIYNKMVFTLKQFEKLEHKKNEIYLEEFTKILQEEIIKEKTNFYE